MNWRTHLRKVFYFEIALNTFSILFMLLATDSFLTGMGLAAPSPVERALVLWFAALLVVITYILARTLWSGDARALRIVLEGYLIGDIIYLIGQYLFVQAVVGVWTGSSLFGVGITILLAAVRVVYLLNNRPNAA